MYKDIIWDFDGTLFDTYPGMLYAFHKALLEEGIDLPKEDILSVMKISVSYAIEYYEKEFNLNVNSFIPRYIFYENNLDKNILVPYEDSREICEAVIKNGGRNFIVTHRDKKTTVDLLEHYNMLSLFTEVVTRDNNFKRKPDSEAFVHLINKYNINRSTAMGIGDRELDILAAEEAGIATCLFYSSKLNSNCKPDYSIDSLRKLYNILSLK